MRYLLPVELLIPLYSKICEHLLPFLFLRNTKCIFFHSRSTTIQTPNLFYSNVVRSFLMLICKFESTSRLFFSKVIFIYRKQLYPQLLISISTYIKSIDLNYRFKSMYSLTLCIYYHQHPPPLLS